MRKFRFTRIARRRQLRVRFLISVGVFLTFATPASSGGIFTAELVNPGLNDTGGEVVTEYETPGNSDSTPGDSTPTGGNGGGGDTPSCGLITLVYGLANGYTASIGTPPETPGFTWYIDTCSNLLVSVEDPPPAVPTGPTQTDVDDLIARARARIEPPRLTIGTSPPIDPGAVVGISTWYWVDTDNWSNQQASASSTRWNLHVTVTAQPLELRFNPGDQAAPGGGQTMSCVGPALAWTSATPEGASDCTYTYDYPSSIDPDGTFTVTAEVDWRLTYVVTGLINQSGTIGTITLASPARELPVVELQAVIS